MKRGGWILILILACAWLPMQQSAATPVVYFEGDCFPEELGFERITLHDPERWIEDGWFVQEIRVGDGPDGPQVAGAFSPSTRSPSTLLR